MNTPHWHSVFDELAAVLKSRQQADPHTSYSAGLLQNNEDALLKKIIEEAGESALAAKSGDKQQLCAELADLWFHCLIVMTRYNIQLSDVASVLAQRRGVGGLSEKAARSTD